MILFRVASFSERNKASVHRIIKTRTAGWFCKLCSREKSGGWAVSSLSALPGFVLHLFHPQHLVGRHKIHNAFIKIIFLLAVNILHTPRFKASRIIIKHKTSRRDPFLHNPPHRQWMFWCFQTTHAVKLGDAFYSYWCCVCHAMCFEFYKACPPDTSIRCACWSSWHHRCKERPPLCQYHPAGPHGPMRLNRPPYH